MPTEMINGYWKQVACLNTNLNCMRTWSLYNVLSKPIKGRMFGTEGSSNGYIVFGNTYINRNKNGCSIFSIWLEDSNKYYYYNETQEKVYPYSDYEKVINNDVGFGHYQSIDSETKELVYDSHMYINTSINMTYINSGFGGVYNVCNCFFGIDIYDRTIRVYKPVKKNYTKTIQDPYPHIVTITYYQLEESQNIPLDIKNFEWVGGDFTFTGNSNDPTVKDQYIIIGGKGIGGNDTIRILKMNTSGLLSESGLFDTTYSVFNDSYCKSVHYKTYSNGASIVELLVTRKALYRFSDGVLTQLCEFDYTPNSPNGWPVNDNFKILGRYGTYIYIAIMLNPNFSHNVFGNNSFGLIRCNTTNYEPEIVFNVKLSNYTAVPYDCIIRNYTNSGFDIFGGGSESNIGIDCRKFDLLNMEFVDSDYASEDDYFAKMYGLSSAPFSHDDETYWTKTGVIAAYKDSLSSISSRSYSSFSLSDSSQSQSSSNSSSMSGSKSSRSDSSFSLSESLSSSQSASSVDSSEYLVGQFCRSELKGENVDVTYKDGIVYVANTYHGPMTFKFTGSELLHLPTDFDTPVAQGRDAGDVRETWSEGYYLFVADYAFGVKVFEPHTLAMLDMIALPQAQCIWGRAYTSWIFVGTAGGALAAYSFNGINLTAKGITFPSGGKVKNITGYGDESEMYIYASTETFLVCYKYDYMAGTFTFIKQESVNAQDAWAEDEFVYVATSGQGLQAFDRLMLNGQATKPQTEGTNYPTLVKHCAINDLGAIKGGKMGKVLRGAQNAVRRNKIIVGVYGLVTKAFIWRKLKKKDTVCICEAGSISAIPAKDWSKLKKMFVSWIATTVGGVIVGWALKVYLANQTGDLESYDVEDDLSISSWSSQSNSSSSNSSERSWSSASSDSSISSESSSSNSSTSFESYSNSSNSSYSNSSTNITDPDIIDLDEVNDGDEMKDSIVSGDKIYVVVASTDKTKVELYSDINSVRQFLDDDLVEGNVIDLTFSNGKYLVLSGNNYLIVYNIVNEQLVRLSNTYMGEDKGKKIIINEDGTVAAIVTEDGNVVVIDVKEDGTVEEITTIDTEDNFEDVTITKNEDGTIDVIVKTEEGENGESKIKELEVDPDTGEVEQKSETTIDYTVVALASDDEYIYILDDTGLVHVYKIGETVELYNEMFEGAIDLYVNSNGIFIVFENNTKRYRFTEDNHFVEIFAQILIGTNKGVILYDYRTDPPTVIDELDIGPVKTIEWYNGYWLVLTEDGKLYIYDVVDGKLKKVSDTSVGKDVTDLFIDENGNLTVTKGTEIITYKINKDGSLTETSRISLEEELKSTVTINDNIVTLTADNKIYIYDKNGNKLSEVELDYTAIGMATDGQYIYILSNDGFVYVYFIDPETYQLTLLLSKGGFEGGIGINYKGGKITISFGQDGIKVFEFDGEDFTETLSLDNGCYDQTFVIDDYVLCSSDLGLLVYYTDVSGYMETFGEIKYLKGIYRMWCDGTYLYIRDNEGNFDVIGFKESKWQILKRMSWSSNYTAILAENNKLYIAAANVLTIYYFHDLNLMTVQQITDSTISSISNISVSDSSLILYGPYISNPVYARQNIYIYTNGSYIYSNGITTNNGTTEYTYSYGSYIYKIDAAGGGMTVYQIINNDLIQVQEIPFPNGYYMYITARSSKVWVSTTWGCFVYQWNNGVLELVDYKAGESYLGMAISKNGITYASSCYKGLKSVISENKEAADSNLIFDAFITR